MPVATDGSLRVATAQHLEQADRGRGRNIQGLDRAGHGNADAQGGGIDQLAPYPLPFGTENPGQRTGPLGVEQRSRAIQTGDGDGSAITGGKGPEIDIFMDGQREMRALPGTQHAWRPGRSAARPEQGLTDAGRSGGAL